MRALQVPSEGASAAVSDIPIPHVAKDSVLIRVKAAGLNAIDNFVADGFLLSMMNHTYPVIIGRDAAGIVEAVGEGVDAFRVGDEVVGHVLLAPPIQQGTLAEYALLPAAAVALKPAGLDFATAAAIPLAGAAALAAVDAIDPQPGQRVLVNGASGGVGMYVVQLLALRDVFVVATGMPADAKRLLNLGATSVVDFSAGSVVEQVLALYSDGVDALIDLASQSIDGAPFGAVRAGGKVSSTTQIAEQTALAARQLTGATVMAVPSSDTLASLLALISSGDIRVEVSTLLKLDNAADGLATIAAGKASGKIVVEF